MSTERRRLPRTGGGMMRVIARHATISTVDDPAHFCQWVFEVATVEGAEGWVAPARGGVEAWFEGSTPAVEAMLEWCKSIVVQWDGTVDVSPQRPCLKGGFEVLEASPTG